MFWVSVWRMVVWVCVTLYVEEDSWASFSSVWHKQWPSTGLWWSQKLRYLRTATKCIWVTRKSCESSPSLPSVGSDPSPLGKSPEGQSIPGGLSQQVEKENHGSHCLGLEIPRAVCLTWQVAGIGEQWAEGICKVSFPRRGSAASQPWIHLILAVKFYLLHDCTGRLLSANLVMFKPASGMRSQEIWVEVAERLLLRSQVSLSRGAEQAVTLMQDAICFFLL